MYIYIYVIVYIYINQYIIPISYPYPPWFLATSASEFSSEDLK